MLQSRIAGMTTRSRVVLGVTLALVAGCASTPEATLERDAEAKRFEPVTRDSVIYIYRGELPSTGYVTTVLANGRLLGSSLPGTFFRILVLPGKTVLETLPPDNGRIEIHTRGNDVAFVEMRTSGSDGHPQTQFRRMTSEIAKAVIRADLRLLETWRHGQPRLLW
jgi:hypothetical protein